MATSAPQLALDDRGARVLANATKTRAQLSTITPRWLSKLLPWEPVEAGIYRVNKVKDPSHVSVACSPRDERDLPETFVDYEAKPREYLLNSITTIVGMSSRVESLYSGSRNQLGEQIRLVIEIIKERREHEVLNNRGFGLLASAAPSQHVSTLSGPPTPDDLDRLISKVWKEPSFFVAHPRAIAAFGRECTRRRIVLGTATLFHNQFFTWHGLPLIPSDKLATDGDRTSILLVRTGAARQGVIGLYKPNLRHERGKGLSVRFMEINAKAIASYLLTLYCSAAVLTEDALAVLEEVELGHYYPY